MHFNFVKHYIYVCVFVCVCVCVCVCRVGCVCVCVCVCMCVDRQLNIYTSCLSPLLSQSIYELVVTRVIHPSGVVVSVQWRNSGASGVRRIVKKFAQHTLYARYDDAVCGLPVEIAVVLLR